MNSESELEQPLGPKRGRPKGSKDKPRPPDAPQRGRPPKNISASVSDGISAVKLHGKSYSLNSHWCPHIFISHVISWR